MSTISEDLTIDWETLVRRYQATVWRYLRYLGADPTEADDLTQETFFAVAKSSFESRSPDETAAYLRTAARHQLLMARRRDRRRVSTVGLSAADQVWASEVGNGGWDDYLSELNKCWTALGGRARRAIDLFYRDGARRELVARELDMTTDGIKTLLRRTRQLLRACVERNVRRGDRSS